MCYRYQVGTAVPYTDMEKAQHLPREDTGPGEAKPEMQGDFRQQPQKEAAGEVIGIHCHQMTHGWSSNNCMMPFPASSASLSDSVPPGTR